jgi:hypothetical protein
MKGFSFLRRTPAFWIGVLCSAMMVLLVASCSKLVDGRGPSVTVPLVNTSVQQSREHAHHKEGHPRGG